MSPRVGVGFDRIGSDADAVRLSGVVALGFGFGGSEILLSERFRGGAAGVAKWRRERREECNSVAWRHANRLKV